MKREVNMRTPLGSDEGKGREEKRIPPPHKDQNLKTESRIITDPFGSWTGVPEDNFFDKPIQDVDDL